MSRFYDILKEAAHSLPNGTVKSTHPGVDITGIQKPLREASALDSRPLPALEPVSLEELPAPVEPLGVLTELSLDPKARIIPHGVDPVVVEHYSKLRTKILQEQQARPFRSLVVTSSYPQEGKTVTTLNLGLSFGLLPSYKVLLIDGDLRRGSLGKWLGIDDHAGLSNVVDGSAQLEDVVLKCNEYPIHFMLRGTSGESPVELLQSPKLKAELQRVSQHYDLVLIDSPPVNLLADVQLLAGSTDAVLMISRAYTTTRSSFEKAAHDLSGFRIVGAVLNGGAQPKRYGRYRNYY